MVAGDGCGFDSRRSHRHENREVEMSLIWLWGPLAAGLIFSIGFTAGVAFAGTVLCDPIDRPQDVDSEHIKEL